MSNLISPSEAAEMSELKAKERQRFEAAQKAAKKLKYENKIQIMAEQLMEHCIPDLILSAIDYGYRSTFVWYNQVKPFLDDKDFWFGKASDENWYNLFMKLKSMLEKEGYVVGKFGREWADGLCIKW